MIQELQLRILPQIAAQQQVLREHIAREKGIDVRTINHIRILKRSIDARQRQVMVNLTVRLYINEQPEEQTFEPVEYHDVSGAKQVVVVGAGPGGLFAALRLVELGDRKSVV